jgi:hypothetical protein
MSALLIFILVIAWKQWPRMGRAGRVGITAACIAGLAGAIAASYWQGTAGSTGGTCGICAIPAASGPATAPSTRSATVTAAVASQPGGGPATEAVSAELVAFYFHRTVRCPTCLQIEEWARQAIEIRFAEEMASGIVEWRPVNIDEPANQHYEKEFGLRVQSLVMVRLANGERVTWKNLTAVWELVGDRAAFEEYVQTELRTLLYGQPGGEP